MNYNEDWREERHRHQQDSTYNPRWKNRTDRQRSNDSGYWNNDQHPSQHSGDGSRSENRYESNWHGEQNANRNPNWDQNAPSSSLYDRNKQTRRKDFEQSGDYGNAYDSRENYNRPNRNYSAQGMTDPSYGNPRFSDRQRLGSNGGSSDRYERGNYGDYTDYRSSGQQFENVPQGRYGSHIESWDDNDDYRTGKSLGRRDLRDMRSDYAEGSHRGKGPKNYKRDDSRIKDDVNDSLTDHHNLDASDIEVEVKDGNVILSGHVESRQAKREAETAIDYISGVNNVENRIHVKSESNAFRTGSSNSNSWDSSSRNVNESTKTKSSDEMKSSLETSKTRNGKTSV